MKKHSVPEPPPNEMVLSYMAIRKAVGYLGMALPVLVSLITWLVGHCSSLENSISEYYYTISGSLFVGTLCAVALFLFTYKGFDKWDRWTSNIASIFALGIAFSPSNMSHTCNHCTILCFQDNGLRNNIHYACAAGFFITLAGMSLFLFTKTDKANPGGRKQARNTVYITCGIIMVTAMLLASGLNIPAFHKLLGRTALFWLEWTMLWAFGISWLVKGELVLKDKT